MIQFSNRKTKKPFWFRPLVVIILVVICILSVRIFHSFTGKIFTPFWKKSNSIKESISDQSIFRSKISMRQEIERLKEENQRLILGLQNKDEVYREIEELRRLVSRTGQSTKRVMASIIAKPNQSAYDTLVISLDTEKTILPNALVLSEPESLIGTIDSVNRNQATVLLFSKSERQTPARLERTKQDVMLIGRGSSNFIIEVPVETDVVLGDRVLYPAFNNTVIGVVRSISNDDRNPSKILHVTAFVNVLELSDVYIVE